MTDLEQIFVLKTALALITGASVYGERIERLQDAHTALGKCEDVARAALATVESAPNADLMRIRANGHYRKPVFG